MAKSKLFAGPAGLTAPSLGFLFHNGEGVIGLKTKNAVWCDKDVDKLDSYVTQEKSIRM